MSNNHRSGGSRSAVLARIAMIALSAVTAIGLRLAFHGFGLSHRAETSAHAASFDAWRELPDEPAALSLDQTPFAGQPTRATTYVHSDGSRNDWISAGTLALGSPNITFSIVRQTKAKPLTYSLARNLDDIDEIKMVRHQYRPTYYDLSTRFGDLRGMMFDVSADGIRKVCLGFQKPISDLIFAKGFVCGLDHGEVTPDRVACLVDQIRFINPADEQALQASLEKGEAKPCGAKLLNEPSRSGKDTL